MLNEFLVSWQGKQFMGPVYIPPRWMTKRAYYEAKRLHRMYYQKLMCRTLKGEIGTIWGVRFVEEATCQS